MSHEQSGLSVNGVKAVVKDMKVTGKGIVLNLEHVQFTGTQLSEVSALVGGGVVLDIQERLPEIRAKETQELSFEANSEKILPSLNDEQVLGQLELQQ